MQQPPPAHILINPPELPPFEVIARKKVYVCGPGSMSRRCRRGPGVVIRDPVMEKCQSWGAAAAPAAAGQVDPRELCSMTAGCPAPSLRLLPPLAANPALPRRD